MSPLAIAIGDALGFSGQGGPGGGGGGPVVPSLPTDQLVAHYKSDAGINLTGSGITATVNQWDNQISSNHNLTQIQGTAWEPTYIPESVVFAGRPMLYGNGDALNPSTTADDFTLTTQGVFTYAFVFKSDGNERYIWDARGQGSGQAQTPGYAENGIERTTASSWYTVGPRWTNAGYGGPSNGIQPYASGSNLNMAPQNWNNVNYPNLFGAGLEIWIYVSNAENSFWICNGRVAGCNKFTPTTPTTDTMAQRMQNLWIRPDKISPSIFSGYYGPSKGYGQGAMAELLVYDKALTIAECNDVTENLRDKYKINYIKSTFGENITANYVGFVRSPSGQVTVNAPNDIYLNGNNYTQYFGMEMKKAIDFTRPGKYELKIGENPAGGANPIFYPAFTFCSPGNAQLNMVYWTSSNFPRLDASPPLRPSGASYWASGADDFFAPGISFRKNADTTYSACIGNGNNPAVYRFKDWTPFTSAGASPPFLVRIEWDGSAQWKGMKWYIDDVLFYEATEEEWLNMPGAIGTTVRYKNPWLPSPACPFTYGRIGRVYDQQLVEGYWVNTPWNYEDFDIVTDGIAGHWDAGSGVTLNGPNVASWEDKVNGHVLSQTDPALQPLFAASGTLGGQPAIQFDKSVGEFLSTTNAGFIPDVESGGFTIIAVCDSNYVGSGSQQWTIVSWSNGTRTQGLRISSAAAGSEQTQTICQAPPASGTITSGYVNNPTSWQTQNGACVSTMGSTGEAKRYYVRLNNRELIDTNGQTTYTASTTSGLSIGADQSGNSVFNGQIQEVIVYNRILSLSEVQQTEKNLMFKYDIFG